MMQADQGIHIIKRFRRNQKLPPVDLASLFMFARPRRKSPGHRTIAGTGQTRRVIWAEFWKEHEAEIYRMLTERIHHHQIADRLGITCIPLEKHLRRMREKDPVKYRQRKIEDYKEIIDRMLAQGALHKNIAKEIGYGERTLYSYFKARKKS